MGTIANIGALLNIVTGGTGYRDPIWQHQDNRNGAAAGAVCVAGRWNSLWRYNKSPGGTGAAPGGTARNPVRTTTGALGQANATGGRELILTGFGVTGLQAGTYLLCDRLADISGLSGTVTTAQNTTSLAVSRYTGAESVGNQIWVQIYTLIGTTGTTITASYTNQDGTAGRTTIATAFGATGLREVERAIMLPLQSGDTGVRSVESVTVLATTGTAGDFGVTIIRPLVYAPFAVAGTGGLIDLLTQLPAMPKIKDDACLDHLYCSSSTAAPISHFWHCLAEA